MMYWLDKCLKLETVVLEEQLDNLSSFMFTIEHKKKLNEKTLAILTTSTVSVYDDDKHEEVEVDEKPDQLELNIDHEKKIDNTKLKKVQQLFKISTHEDNLFWSIYCGFHGKPVYIDATHKKNVETEEKNSIGQMFHINKNNLKDTLESKITKASVDRLVSDLVTFPRTPIQCVYAYTYYYKSNIIIANELNHTYLMFNCHNPVNTVVIYKMRKDYYIDFDYKFRSLDELKEEYVHINEIKPFKAASNYKVCDLESFAKKTKLDYTTPILKKTLYEQLMLHCVWK